MNELKQARKTSEGSLLRRVRQAVATEQFNRLSIMVIGSLLVLTALLGAVSPVRYSLSVGMVPTSTIFATKDVVDEITTQNNRSLAAAAVTPIYQFADGVTDQVINNADNVFTQLSAVRQYAQTLPDYGPSRVYSEDELTYAYDMLTLVTLRDYQLTTLMNATQTQYDELISSLRSAIKNTMQGHVTQGQESIAINSIMQIVGYKTSVGLLQNVVLPVLRAIIVPNMVVDQEKTDAAKETAMKAVEPVIYKQGQSIVVRGEGRARPNQLAMLSSLGLLQENKVDYQLYAGAAIAAGATLVVLLVVLWHIFPNIIRDRRKLLLLFSVLLLMMGLSLVTKSIQIVYLAPLITSAILLTVMVGFVPAIIIHVSSSLLCIIILGGTVNTGFSEMVALFAASLVAGTTAAFIISRPGQQRPLILAAGAASAVLSFLVIWAFGLMNSNTSSDLSRSLYASGGALLSAILSMALQPLAETVFNLPTNNRLMELSNPNHPLLRRLLLEAPGTYHHSILIANLAEASAEAVGANPLLARIGGYYHDIGKLKRPLYFKENQIGSGNIHDTTNPSVSAAIITAHVRDGLVLGKQYRLPAEVLQIITQHHGNSRVAYFYSKAGEPVDDEDFRYDGTPPESAEVAIVMLCDTIEAAVRTLSTPTPDEITAFIWKLIRGKMEEGLLQKAPLTLQNLYTIRDVCATMVYGIFHERIEYPGAEKQSAIARMRSSLASAVQYAPLAPPTSPIKKKTDGLS